MPQHRFQILDFRFQHFIRICFFLVSGIWYLSSFAIPVRANTDPQSATVSATATVPAAAPTTGDTTAPTAPILIRPADGTITSDPKPEFAWYQSTDPNSNTVVYTLYLDGVATFLGISNLGNSAGIGYTARIEGGEVRLLPTNPLPEGNYNWYVTASDLSSNSSRSASWHFVIDLTPPILTLLDIDQTYPNPFITEGANFDIRGPKDVYFTVLSEPFSTLTLQLDSASYSYPVPASGLAYPYRHLRPGVYRVIFSSVDHANLTTALPAFTLTITESVLLLPGPLAPLSPLVGPVLAPLLPLDLPSLPATIYRLTTTVSPAYILMILLAVIAIMLIILLWYHSPNILILEAATHRPYRTIILYHSRPTTRRGQTLLSTRAPALYLPNHRGLGRIPHLGRYSTLTIRVGASTHVLSLSRSLRLYTILL